MTDSSKRSSAGLYGFMLVSFVVTIVFVVISTRSVPETPFWRGAVEDSSVVRADASSPVSARLTKGAITVTRSLPTLAFRVEPGQSLDPRLPAGPFTGTFTVRLDPGAVKEAFLGAQWQGGQLIIRRRGEVLVSDHAGRESRQAMTTAPGAPLADGETLEYEFTADGTGPSGLRGLWQPLASLVPLPLPVESAPLPVDASLRGMVLAQKLNCVACHASVLPARQATLAAAPAPILGAVGGRARPGWIRDWIRNPGVLKPGTRMPRLAHDAGLGDAEIEDLVHFLASMGGPLEVAAATSEALAATGRVLYHRVGCVPCHGPLEPIETLPGGNPRGGKPWRRYEPLGRLAAKTTPARLAAFLRDPLATHPAGLMPAQLLDDLEAEAIATYLVARDAASRRGASAGSTGERPPFTLDATRVPRGRTAFAARGCASCHELGPDRTAVASTLVAPPLEVLAAATGTFGGRAGGAATVAARGCLAPAPPAGAARYTLTDDERGDLIAFLSRLPTRKTEDVPVDALLADMRRLNCTACHAFHGDLGPESAILSCFLQNGDADLGDEGRIPPVLTNAGARMTTAWMRDVLAGGQRARPYIASRMPDYGVANVDRLPELLAAAAGATGWLDREPEFSVARAAAGRDLVGAGGLNCIQCHTIAGQDSTGTPGPDLALMPGRLRYEGFARWLHDPARIRPGTRMPSFFVAGRSPATGVLGGRAEPQVEAIWSYLSQGEMLALPDGLVEPGGLELVVRDEPIVFRTFMASAGVRAIACGFPEQIHCAFDADRCVLAVAWQGRFLSAQGAWGARGGSETNPETTAWTSPSGPLLEIADADTTASFRGYRLDEQRRPIFDYELAAGVTRVAVEERPAPRYSGDGAALVRGFTLDGPPGTRIAIHAGDLAARGDRLVAGDGGTHMITLDDNGHADFELEVTW